MLKSSNDMTMGQNFTVKVVKQSDGSFKATCKNEPKLSATGSSANLATSKMNDLLHKKVMEG